VTGLQTCALPISWPDPLPAWFVEYQAGGPPKWFDAGTGDFTVVPSDEVAPEADDIVLTAERIGDNVFERSLTDQNLSARIYVFLAGHGLRAPIYHGAALETCFIASDFQAATGNVARGLVPCSSLNRSLRSNRFHEVLMFLDCCRTDPSAVTFRALPICDDTIKDDELPGTSIGHATQPDGRAYETESAPCRGAFSKTLMEGLRGLREPNSQALTVRSLETYVQTNIGSATPMDQRPYFQFHPVDRPLTVVTGPPVTQFPPGPLVRLPKKTAVTLELVDTHSNILWNGGPYPAGSEPVQLQNLQSGLYGIRINGNPGQEITFRQPLQREIHVPEQ